MDFFSKCDQEEIPFAQEILNGKHFLCSEHVLLWKDYHQQLYHTFIESYIDREHNQIQKNKY